jgi:hypothetical protein
VTQDDLDPGDLEVVASAYEYLPSMTSVPTRTQDVVEVMPSEELVKDADVLSRECRDPA